MENTPNSSSWEFVLVIALFSLVLSCRGNSKDNIDKKVYIVYMGDPPKTNVPTRVQHMSMLQGTLGSKRANESLIYSYKRSFNGFVAKLTEGEKERIASLKGVVSVFLNTKRQLHTTRSWDFMGFPLNVQRSQAESDVIIGMLDSGIWPESQSFNDTGYGPPPRKWKGICESSTPFSSPFSCNNKIIGARYFRSDDYIIPPDVHSPRDTDGHGTHTASTAAGALVSGANLYGLAAGTAHGGVPSARIAVYKVCWYDGCSNADILAGFDYAIDDGVDIISVSLGSDEPYAYFEDPIAIGAFHAMKKGVLTSNSAGNSGPALQTITNFAPWALSVAASTIDRKFVAKLHLGNGKVYEGVTLNTFTLKDGNYPLVYGGNVPNIAKGYNGSVSRYCKANSLDRKLVNGTIVLCDAIENLGAPAVNAGAMGAVIQTNAPRDVAFPYLLPASRLGLADGGEVYDYINKTSKPEATIFKSSEENETSAPFVVSFSSRGPNPFTKNILKPDLAAPGVDILAAFSEHISITGYNEDNRVAPYNIISGTSMACPHASGAAAYVKSFNPTWSPAAIRSALMTTATPMSSATNPDAELAYGSGHINPLKAKSPGLVYDIEEADYVKFLCSQGYSNEFLDYVTGDNTSCSTPATVYDLNYPSFSVYGASTSSVNLVFHRTVTNVGTPSSVYKAVVTAPVGLRIQVQPSSMSFTSLGEKQSFVVVVNATIKDAVMSGSLVWDNGVYQVRSPVVAFKA